MTNKRDQTRRPLLAEVYCHDYSPDQGATYVRIHNPLPDPADLTGWTLEWNGTPLRFPRGADLSGGGSLYVAWSPPAFAQDLDRQPDYTLQPAPGVPTLETPAAPPTVLTPDRGSIRLLAPDGEPADAVAWGDIPAPRGWQGATAAPPERGTVLQRAVVEATVGPDGCGDCTEPGGNAAAWRQGSDWLPRRLARAGQGCFSYPTWPADSALAFTAPDAAFATVADFIDSANTRLDINLYLFTHPDLAARVEAALRRRVSVHLLMEGEPYGGMPVADRDTITRLEAAGATVRVLRTAASGFKRYHFNHAKYAIADSRHCLIMSDNWTRSSLPNRPQTGQRGWGVVLDCPPLARHLLQVLAFDSNPRSPDNAAFDPTHPAWSVGLEAAAIPDGQWPARALPNPVAPARFAGPVPVTCFLAPQHALLETRAICGLMRSARHTLDIQQQSAERYWEYDDAGSTTTTPNLFLAEVLAAARRGVQVRLLMGGAFLNPDNPRDNTHTHRWCRELAEKEHLPLQARILDEAATGMGIHNKGLIVDGQQVLISSVNWSQNSPLNNRELGLILDHAGLADYFTALFTRDWAGGK